MRFGRILGSTTLRLALVLAIAQVAIFALGLTLLHRFTLETIIADARTTAEVARDDLMNESRDDGIAGLRQAIEDRIAAQDDPNLLLLLKDRAGRPIAGNIDRWPAGLPDRSRWRIITLESSNGNADVEAGVITQPIGTEATLLTGQTLTSKPALGATSARALVVAVLGGGAMALFVAFGLARLLSRRIDVFANAASAVAAGRLDARVDRDATGDAFDRLGHSINRMLDRNETLVRELRMLTDSMAHDLRSPVSRLTSALQQARGRTDDPAAVAALGTALTEADELRKMLDTALDISRAEAGIGRDQFETFSADALLEDLADLFGPFAEEQGFRLDVDAPEPVEIFAHRDYLSRAIANLIENAIKHGHGGQAITLSADMIDAATMRLAVTDDGQGIAPADMADALKRFGRLDPARSTRGAGLGLSLVETIAHLHNGSLHLEQNDPRGLRVILCMPVARAPEPPRPS